ncbi:hypothetical protein [Streptomyces massasporeus]|uniref:hypothetical protein n=1 Tax=Streptomyces massasporeus TaxID=67324 RepID=UPI00372389F3
MAEQTVRSPVQSGHGGAGLKCSGFTRAETAATRRTRPGLVFGYGSISAPDIGPGLDRLLRS